MSEEFDPDNVDDEDLKKWVRETYDSIAEHFALTRENLWDPMREFINEVSPCVLGDLGCGTGRAVLAAAALGSEAHGVDSSVGQLEIARSKIAEAGLSGRVHLLRADLEELPLRDSLLDNCMMIASLHHLPSRSRRIDALKEALRCTASGGRIQISVWSWDQERFRELHLSRVDGRRDPSEFDGPGPGDFIVPWKRGTEAGRFYHLYGPGELEKETVEAGWYITRSYFDGGNHWIEGMKMVCPP